VRSGTGTGEYAAAGDVLFSILQLNIRMSIPVTGYTRWKPESITPTFTEIDYENQSQKFLRAVHYFLWAIFGIFATENSVQKRPGLENRSFPDNRSAHDLN
jgi:hypothetical protein